MASLRKTLRIADKGTGVKRCGLAMAVAGLVALTGCAAEDEFGSLTGQQCVKNAFGAEFCGEEAVQMCQEFGGPACAEITGDTKGRVGRELEEMERQAEQEQLQLERELDQQQRDLERELEALGDGY